MSNTRIGMLAIVGAGLAALALLLWLRSPLLLLEHYAGFDLPSGIRFTMETTSRDQFFGQGFTFRVFSAPPDSAAQWKTSCPTGFLSKRLDQTSIWLRIVEWDQDASAPACERELESATNQEIIVISGEWIYHMSIDM